MSDPVNNPKHYQLPGLDIQVLDVRAALLKTIPPNTDYDAVTSWSESWTYLTRMWSKNGLEDAKKARFYLDRVISILETQEMVNRC